MASFDALGLLVSAYLTYLSLVPPTSCIVGEFSVFSCDRVIWSEYSHFYGVSVALLGFGWFVIASCLLLIAWRSERYIRAVFAWSLLGAAGVAALSTQKYSLSDRSAHCVPLHTSPAWRYSRSRQLAYAREMSLHRRTAHLHLDMTHTCSS